MPLIFAAAGLAEAAWFFYMLLTCPTFLILTLLNFISIRWKSPILATITASGVAVVSLVLQPWHCFMPFRDEDYADPDVASAIPEFYATGITWLLAVISSFTAVLYNLRLLRDPAVDAEDV